MFVLGFLRWSVKWRKIKSQETEKQFVWVFFNEMYSLRGKVEVGDIVLEGNIACWPVAKSFIDFFKLLIMCRSLD